MLYSSCKGTLGVVLHSDVGQVLPIVIGCSHVELSFTVMLGPALPIAAGCCHVQSFKRESDLFAPCCDHHINLRAYQSLFNSDRANVTKGNSNKNHGVYFVLVKYSEEGLGNIGSRERI